MDTHLRICTCISGLLFVSFLLNLKTVHKFSIFSLSHKHKRMGPVHFFCYLFILFYLFIYFFFFLGGGGGRAAHVNFCFATNHEYMPQLPPALKTSLSGEGGGGGGDSRGTCALFSCPLAQNFIFFYSTIAVSAYRGTWDPTSYHSTNMFWQTNNKHCFAQIFPEFYPHFARIITSENIGE